MATNWRRFFPVEPVIFFYTYSLMMSLPVYQQYVYSRASKEIGLPYSYDKEETKGGCAAHGGNNTNSSYLLRGLEKKVFDHSLFDFIVFGLSLVSGDNDCRKTKEMRLIQRLGTINPYGMNERFSFL